METLKLHNLELSSIFWEVCFLMTEKDVVNLLRLVTSWYDLSKTDLGRKALEIDCYETFKKTCIFSEKLRKLLHQKLTGIENRKRSLTKVQLANFEYLRELFEFKENEMAEAAKENSCQFISTSKL